MGGKLLTFLSLGISLVFHPLFMLLYILLLILIINPFVFGYRSLQDGLDLLVFTAVVIIPIPVIAILMFKGLGLVRSLHLRTKQERIGPYIITAIVYLSLYVQLARNQTSLVYQAGVLGAVITVFVVFFINNFRMISAHAAGMGGLTAFASVLVLRFADSSFSLPMHSDQTLLLPSGVAVIAAILLSGIVATARLLLKAHTSTEVYAGYAAGFLSMLIAFNIMM